MFIHCRDINIYYYSFVYIPYFKYSLAIYFRYIFNVTLEFTVSLYRVI